MFSDAPDFRRVNLEVLCDYRCTHTGLELPQGLVPV